MQQFQLKCATETHLLQTDRQTDIETYRTAISRKTLLHKIIWFLDTKNINIGNFLVKEF